jgi:MoxR-like ATPase
MRLSVGYPPADVERELLLGGGTASELKQLKSVADALTVRRLQAAVPLVQVAPEIADYVLALVAATRKSPLVSLGASPRGALALLRAAQARALFAGRNFVEPDDVKDLAVACLAHRLALAGSGQGAASDRLTAERVMRDLCEQVAAPE